MFNMRKKKVLRNLRYQCRVFCCVLFTVCVSGLLFLQTSCTTEIENKHDPKKGPKIPVNFSVNIDAYDNDEMVDSRSYNVKEPVTETVHIANGIYLCATLEEEEPVNTRAATTTTIPDGTLVKIVAYHNSDNSFETECDYTVAGGELIPVTPPEMAVSPGVYKFRAFAFNTPSLPALSATPPRQTTETFSIPGGATEPLLDLLWGKGTVEPVTITASSPPYMVEIKVDHLFSRVRVEASTGTISSPPVLIDKIENAFVNPHYAGNATLNVVTGALTPVSVPPSTGVQLTEWAELGTTSWGNGSSLGFSDVTSNYRIIYTNNADSLALKIGNLEVAGKPLGAYPLRLIKKLQPGYSYVLKLSFKRLVWAGSNIFWDAPGADPAFHRLTFLPENAELQNQGFQGVYFLWGSLIGIAPNDNFTDGGTALYAPPVGVTRPNWTTPFANSLNLSPIKPWTGLTMIDIPHVTGGNLYSPDWLDNHSARNYLSNDAHDTINYKGDICKYLTQAGFAPPGVWRMPNAREFEPLTDYSNANTVAPMYGSTLTNGMSDFYNAGSGNRSYLTKTVVNTSYITVFPDGYSRIAYAKDRTTRYLSGSPNYAANPNTVGAFYSLNFSNVSTVIATNTPLNYQGLVRCVKLDEVELRYFLNLPIVRVEDWTSGGTVGGGADGDIVLN